MGFFNTGSRYPNLQMEATEEIVMSRDSRSENTNANHISTRMDAFADSSFSKVLGRLAVLSMPFIVGALGYLMAGFMSDIKENTKAFWHEIGIVKDQQSIAINKLDTTIAQFSLHIKEDDKSNSNFERILADHEARIRAKESVIRLPSQQ